MAQQFPFFFQLFLLILISFVLSTSAAVLKRASYVPVSSTTTGDEIFELGNITYLAALKQPKTTFKTSLKSFSGTGFAAVVATSGKTVTGNALKATLAEYMAMDDVLTEDFMSTIYLTSRTSGASLDKSAVEHLSSMGIEDLYLHASFITAPKGGSFKTSIVPTRSSIAPGPYVTSTENGMISFAPVYRLYPDSNRNFLFGAYDSGDGQGTHIPLGTFLPKLWDPMIR